MRSALHRAETPVDARGAVWIRTAGVRDVEGLGDHFASLSQVARHNRFMGEANNISRIVYDCLVQGWRADRFTLVAEAQEKGGAIVGEASYGFRPDEGCGEFAISVADRWQRQGLGSALLCALQFRAVSLGHFTLFGETLKTNEPMKCLAHKAGFTFSRSPDWRAVRLDKHLAG